jgi:hypothetical protein
MDDTVCVSPTRTARNGSLLLGDSLSCESPRTPLGTFSNTDRGSAIITPSSPKGASDMTQMRSQMFHESYCSSLCGNNDSLLAATTRFCNNCENVFSSPKRKLFDSSVQGNRAVKTLHMNKLHEYTQKSFNYERLSPVRGVQTRADFGIEDFDCPSCFQESMPSKDALLKHLRGCESFAELWRNAARVTQIPIVTLPCPFCSRYFTLLSWWELHRWWLLTSV